MIPSLRRIRRTLEIETACRMSLLQMLERIPGNPAGVAFRHIGEGTIAFMARDLAAPALNRVVGLRAGLESHVEPLVDWYHEAGLEARFETVPGYIDPSLGRELVRVGYYQSSFRVSLVCGPELRVSSRPEVAVERVENAVQMEELLRLCRHEPGGLPPGHLREIVGQLHDEPGWSLYLVRITGRPGAAAAIYFRDGVGYWLEAAVDPVFRGHGLETALLGRSIAEAAATGADFVCSDAELMSPAHWHMVRAGMQIQFVRATWGPLGALGDKKHRIRTTPRGSGTWDASPPARAPRGTP